MAIFTIEPKVAAGIGVPDVLRHENNRQTFQDDEGVWAEFVEGRFETHDKRTIDRLKHVPGVKQIDG